MSLENSTNKIYDDNEQDESEQELSERVKTKAASDMHHNNTR